MPGMRQILRKCLLNESNKLNDCCSVIAAHKPAMSPHYPLNKTGLFYTVPPPPLIPVLQSLSPHVPFFSFLRVVCIYLVGWPSQSATDRLASIIEFIFSTVLEVGHWTSRHEQVWFLLSPLLGWQMGIFYLSLHMVVSLCLWRFALISSPAILDQGPPEQPPGNLITPFEALSPNIATS